MTCCSGVRFCVLLCACVLVCACVCLCVLVYNLYNTIHNNMPYTPTHTPQHTHHKTPQHTQYTTKHPQKPHIPAMQYVAHQKTDRSPRGPPALGSTWSTPCCPLPLSPGHTAHALQHDQQQYERILVGLVIIEQSQLGIWAQVLGLLDYVCVPTSVVGYMGVYVVMPASCHLINTSLPLPLPTSPPPPPLPPHPTPLHPYRAAACCSAAAITNPAVHLAAQSPPPCTALIGVASNSCNSSGGHHVM